MMHLEWLDIALIGGVPVLILLAVFLGMKLSPRIRALPPLGPGALLLIGLIPAGVLVAVLVAGLGDHSYAALWPLVYFSVWPAAAAFRRAKTMAPSVRRTGLRLAAASVQLAGTTAYVMMLADSAKRLWSLSQPTTLLLTLATSVAVAGILGTANWVERKKKPSNTPPSAMEPTA